MYIYIYILTYCSLYKNQPITSGLVTPETVLDLLAGAEGACLMVS